MINEQMNESIYLSSVHFLDDDDSTTHTVVCGVLVVLCLQHFLDNTFTFVYCSLCSLTNVIQGTTADNSRSNSDKIDNNTKY